MTDPAPAPRPTTCDCHGTITVDEWMKLHCYHCGKALVEIEANGPTPDCICDPNSPR